MVDDFAIPFLGPGYRVRRSDITRRCEFQSEKVNDRSGCWRGMLVGSFKAILGKSMSAIGTSVPLSIPVVRQNQKDFWRAFGSRKLQLAASALELNWVISLELVLCLD